MKALYMILQAEITDLNDKHNMEYGLSINIDHWQKY
jgi:hypothetical protein